MNIFKYILEINDASYRWYFAIISSLIIINFLIPESLGELGISLKLLIIIFIIALPLYYLVFYIFLYLCLFLKIKALF